MYVTTLRWKSPLPTKIPGLLERFGQGPPEPPRPCECVPPLCTTETTILMKLSTAPSIILIHRGADPSNTAVLP